MLLSDGGPHRRAAHHPIVDPHRVSRLLVNLAKRAGERAAAPDDVIQVDARAGRAVGIWIVSNPDKLHHVPDLAR